MVTLWDIGYKPLLTIALATTALMYLYFYWAFYYWRRKGVESVPASIPFGSAAKIITRKASFGGQFKEIYDKYKAQGLRYVGFYLFTKPALVLLDIHLIKTILTKDFQYFTDHGNYVNEELEPLTANLFSLQGQRWKDLRAKLTPTFTSGKMKMMFHTLVDCSNGLREVMDDFVKQEEPIDIKDVVARYTTDVIGSCAFGLDCNSLKNPNSEFRQFGKNILAVSIFEQFVRFLSLVSPQLVAGLRIRTMNPKKVNFLMDIVKKTVKYREETNVKRKDFMHLLIQLKNNVQLKEEELENLKNDDSAIKSHGLTMEQIAAQVLVFFIAGFETSSTTLAFCFYELVSNPDIQVKLRSEIIGVLEKYDNNITYEGLMSMTYMDKCIQETLRKYPPVSRLTRECTENYTIPDTNVQIEKGTLVFIPTLGIHHDPEFFPNPDKFDPERFTTENKASRDHFAWLPFGEGPRACIGLRFGLMQTKVALAALLKHYEFSLSNKTETPLVMCTSSLVTAARGDIWLNVKKH